MLKVLNLQMLFLRPLEKPCQYNLISKVFSLTFSPTNSFVLLVHQRFYSTVEKLCKLNSCVLSYQKSKEKSLLFSAALYRLDIVAQLVVSF